MGYIPKSALQNLRKYVYKGVDKSLLSRYVLNPFWTWFVTLWPLNVAPNTITLSGLIIVAFNVVTLLYYDAPYLTDKDGATGPPQWIYFTWGIGLFLYQTFDAIDGKQARRTGMAGPLGELFDHGCDALNTTLEVILAGRALNLGRSWWTVASQIVSLGSFYLTTWEEYHTGQLYLSHFSGPVEGIIMICSIYFITGIYGPSFWDTRFLHFTGLDNIPIIVKYIPNIGLNDAFMVFGAFGLAFNIFSSYFNVQVARTAKGESTMKPLLQLLPFPLSALMQILWLAHPSYKESAIVYSSLLLPFLCAWGLQFARQVGRMILAHVTKSDFPYWDSMLIWSVIGAVDAHLPTLIGIPPVIQSTSERMAIFIYITLAISFVSYARFCTLVIKDITEYLGIACFTVQKKDDEGHWRNPQEIADTLGRSN